MGWGCYKHEMDAGSEEWKEVANKLCNEQLEKPGKRTWGRNGAICPKCYIEERAAFEKLKRRMAEVEKLISKACDLSMSHVCVRGKGDPDDLVCDFAALWTNWHTEDEAERAEVERIAAEEAAKPAPFDPENSLDCEIKHNYFPETITDTSYFERRTQRTKELRELGELPAIPT